MKYLIQGGESKERIDLLLQLTGIRAKKTISAIKEHYVNGLPISRCAARFGVDLGLLSRRVKTLNEKTAIHEQLKEIE